MDVGLLLKMLGNIGTVLRGKGRSKKGEENTFTHEGGGGVNDYPLFIPGC